MPTVVSSLRRSFEVVPLVVALCLLMARVHPAVAGIDRWTNEGPLGADISAIAIDPDDADTVYVGTNGGGVFKSIDGGTSWSAAREGIDAASVSRIHIDPNDTQTLYAVTVSTATNRYPGGLYKSTNGGSTWNAVDEGLGDAFISGFVIDERNPGTLYVAVSDRDEGGVFKSTDGAETWMRILGEPGAERDVRQIALDPSDSQSIFASTTAGLRKTIDGGESWEPVGNGLPFANSVLGFAFDPFDTETIYACGSGGLGTRGVYKSTDGGENWNPTQTEEAASVRQVIAVPGVSGTLYARATEGIIKTSDGGDHWELMIEGLPPRRFGYEAFDLAASDPERLYFGLGPAAPAPVYRSDDGAASWQAAGVNGLTNTFLLSLAVDPTAPQVRYVATDIASPDGLQPLLKGGDDPTSWVPSNVGLPNAQILLVDPAEPNILYAGTGNDGVFKSTDTGATWKRSNVGISGTLVRCLTIDPHDRQTLYACASREPNLFKTSNGGATWEPSADGLQDDDAERLPVVRMVAVDPSTPGTLYAATSDQGVFKSTDGAETWQMADEGMASPEIQSLAIDPVDSQIVHAGGFAFTGVLLGPGGVYKSTDGGGSWQPANGGKGQPIATADVRALVIESARPQVLYAATNIGVFRSVDAAASWTLLDEGLFSPDVRALVVDPLDPDVLHAATFGGGVFSIEQSCGDGSVPCPVTPTPVPCAGDCDRSGDVTLDELVLGVRIALGAESLASCVVIDRDDDDTVRIDELLAAVEAAVTICHTKQPPVPTPTPTNPPGMCCCGSHSFVQCQELAAAGECFGWGDPCPTATSGPSADGATD